MGPPFPEPFHQRGQLSRQLIWTAQKRTVISMLKAPHRPLYPAIVHYPILACNPKSGVLQAADISTAKGSVVDCLLPCRGRAG